MILEKNKSDTYLKIGKLLSPNGLLGEANIYVTSSFILKRFKINSIVYIELNENELEEVKIKSFKKKKGNIYVISFFDIDSIEKINKYINLEVLSIKDTTLLKKDEYYIIDLVDSIVIDNNSNKEIGKISNVIDSTYNNLVEITLKNNKKIYLPFIDVYFIDVDIKNKKVTLNVIEGLLDI